MKKVMFVALATICSSVMFAQTTTVTPTKTESVEVKKELLDIKDERQDELERKEDLKAGDKAGAKKMKKDIKANKADIKRDIKRLKSEGVKHPNHRPEHEMHRGGKH